MSKHALLIENLEIDTTKADAIVEALKEFAENVGYSSDRISELECRSRDGFIPYSHNYGGIECVAFAFPYSLPNGCTGFPKADATIEKYSQMNKDHYSEQIGVNENDWTDKQREEFFEYEYSDDQASILYSLDIMHTGLEAGIHSINLRFCVCVKDMPYHRKYDDLIDIDISFKTLNGLKGKLAKIAKRKDIKQFSKCLSDAY